MPGAWGRVGGLRALLCTVRQAPAASGAGEVEAPPRAQAVRARREPRSIQSKVCLPSPGRLISRGGWPAWAKAVGAQEVTQPLATGPGPPTQTGRACPGGLRRTTCEHKARRASARPYAVRSLQGLSICLPLCTCMHLYVHLSLGMRRLHHPFQYYDHISITALHAYHNC